MNRLKRIFLGLFFCSTPVFCQDNPVADVLKVMEVAEETSSQQIWPGFMSNSIPVLVYDSVNTYLFNSVSSPDNFASFPGNTNVFTFKGQHPQVRGNSITRMGDTWVATSVLTRYSVRTQERYSTRDMAGIIVHEQFHIFQRMKHPAWRQNDGVLLFYPEETKETLLLRRLEKEAFKRAVTSGKNEDAAGWSKVAMNYRKERLALIDEHFGTYEKELQRTEGLSDYIEKVTRGVDPLNASTITNGIAPAGVRDLGYIEGRWIALILDNLNPSWKSLLEKNDSLYLEEILETTINGFPSEMKSFTPDEIAEIKATVLSDFENWQVRKKEEIDQFYRKPGYRIEINSSDNPMNIRIFEPLEIELLENNGVFHRLIFSAANNNGSLRIMNHPSITFFDNTYRLNRLIICGLKKAPEVNQNENRVRLKYDDITLDFTYKSITGKDTTFVVEL